MATVHLLANPAARRGRIDAAAVADQLLGMGQRVERIDPAGADDVAAAVRRAAPDRVVLVGGDGLIHRALPALVESQIPVGIVPSGTGNDFARALGLPGRRSHAVERAMGPVSPVDVMEIERPGEAPTLVASVATAGFSGRVNATANSRSFPKGQLKYTAASFTELRRLRSFDLTVRRSEGGSRADDLGGPCTFFAIANTRFFGGGMAIAPDAVPTDGQLRVVVVRSVPRWQLAAVLPTVFLGQHVKHPRVEQWSGPRIELDHGEDLWADGELIGPGSLAVSIRSRALFVAAF